MTQTVVSEQVSITIDAHGVLQGSYPGAVLQSDVKVLYNGEDWATVPLRPAAETAGKSFTCDLPNVASDLPEDGEVSVFDLSGKLLASVHVTGRLPKRNAAGILTSEIERIHDRPFSAVLYWSFDGAKLTITGSHLPPGGDPSALEVEFGPGVAYKLIRAIYSPDWELHFWYWPNARFSDFQIIVDLAESELGCDPFTFRFKCAKGSGRDLPEPHGRVWIPRDLGSVVGFPTDPTQLTRVQTWSDSRTVTLTGYNVYQTVAALLKRYGVSSVGTTLMDWGCGHGRVTRHFIREWPLSQIVGMDVDAENAKWAAATLAPGKFVVSPLLPPCPLPDGCLDALFSISVMTHLAPDIQQLWLAELARLLRPKAIALMSFGGPGAVAWSSVWNGPDYFSKWQRDGIHADTPDTALAGKIEDPGYYRNVAQTHAHVLETWCRDFEILQLIPNAVGNLDIAVLKRR